MFDQIPDPNVILKDNNSEPNESCKNTNNLHQEFVRYRNWYDINRNRLNIDTMHKFNVVDYLKVTNSKIYNNFIQVNNIRQK